MPVYSNIFILPIGATSFAAPELSFSTILGVKRQGLGYTDTFGSAPGNREFLYSSPAGTITFELPGEEVENENPAVDVMVPEKIYVLWKN